MIGWGSDFATIYPNEWDEQTIFIQKVLSLLNVNPFQRISMLRVSFKILCELDTWL